MNMDIRCIENEVMFKKIYTKMKSSDVLRAVGSMVCDYSKYCIPLLGSSTL